MAGTGEMQQMGSCFEILQAGMRAVVLQVDLQAGTLAEIQMNTLAASSLSQSPAENLLVDALAVTPVTGMSVVSLATVIMTEIPQFVAQRVALDYWPLVVELKPLGRHCLGPHHPLHCSHSALMKQVRHWAVRGVYS